MDYIFYFIHTNNLRDCFSSSNVYADEQVPASVVAVEGDPYYFSEGEFRNQDSKVF